VQSREVNNNEKGFVLVAALFLIAFLSLGVAYLSQWVRQEIVTSKVLQKKTKALVDATSLKTDFIFFLLTKRLNIKGLELTDKPAPTIGAAPQESEPDAENSYVSLFNKPYKKDDLIIQIQDEAGLINLGRLTKEQFHRLFQLFEIEQDAWDSLYWKFKDYVKTEKAVTKALLGATIEDYTSQGKPEPSNEPLRTPFETKRILEWENHENFYKNNRLANAITTIAQKPINVNTAPKEVLAFIQGFNEDAINKILEHRFTDPPFFKDMNAVANTTGVPLNQSRGFGLLPATTQRVTITSIEPNILNLQFSVTAKPRDKDIPWQINYQIDVPYNPVKLDDIDGEEDEKEKLAKLAVFSDPKDIHTENK
jgi:hypothetical protein